MKKILNIGLGKICRKCKGQCFLRKRKKIPEHKNFYYTQWDYCPKCKAVYFEEQYKSQAWQEQDRQDNFFKSLRY